MNAGEYIIVHIIIVIYGGVSLKRVLIVDDAQFMRYSLRIIPEKNG